MTNGTTAPRASPTTPAARLHGGQAFDRRVARAVSNGCRFDLIRRRADDERSHHRDRSRSDLRGQHRLTPATTTPRSAPSAAVMEGRAEHERHASALGAPGRDWPGAQLDQPPGQARCNWLSSSGASTATAISGDQAPRPIRDDQLSPRKVCSDHADGAGSHKATTAARASAAVAEPPRSVSPVVGQTDCSAHGAGTQRSPLLRMDRPAAESDSLQTPPTTPTGGQHTLRAPPAAARTPFSQALHQASRQRRTGRPSPTRLLRGLDHAATSDEPPPESAALLRSPQTPRSAGRVRHLTDPIRGNFDPPITSATSSLPDLSAVDDDLFADLIYTYIPPTRQVVRSGTIITRLR